jgi:hypothetical protein
MSDIFGNLFGGDDMSAARDAAANIQLQNFDLKGPGGMSVGFTPTGGNVALGSLDPIRAMLLQAVSGNVGGGVPGLAGLTGAAGDAMSALSGSGVDPRFMQLLAGLTARQVGSGGMPSLGPTGVSPDLIAQLTGAAGSKLATASMSPDAAAADRLGVLRAQAQPYEQDFINKQLGDVFARGRFGSNDSVSGNVSDSIARALTSADQARQAQAMDYGRQMTGDAAQQGLALSAGASGLLGDQFTRALQQFTAGQSGQNDELTRILQGIGGMSSLGTSNSQNALNRFGVAQNLFNSTNTGSNDALTRALGALGGVGTIDQSGMQQFMAALQAATARSNAASGASNAYMTLANNSLGQKYMDMASSMVNAIMPG